MSTTDNPTAPSVTDLLESARTDSAEGIGAIEASVKRIRELNEQAIKAARAAGLSALDAYQAALESVVDAEEKLAEGSHVDWFHHADHHTGWVHPTPGHHFPDLRPRPAEVTTIIDRRPAPS